MSLSKQIKATLQNERKGTKSKDYKYAELFRKNVLEQRQLDAAVIRIEKPSNLPRAHALGYKAKQGYVIALTRVRKGSGLHRRPARGRRPKRMGVKKLTRRTGRKAMGERKAGQKFPNCEVLNSYWVGEDGKSTYYEVILADTASMTVRSDKERNWVVFNKHTNRAERGLTSAGRKSRGLHKKGRGAEKIRPSNRAKGRKAK
ncbi:MAG TPA: 50S ribosomal protein L15e [archaeon]|nr:50S ribosomal protein L15e [archaeon]